MRSPALSSYPPTKKRESRPVFTIYCINNIFKGQKVKVTSKTRRSNAGQLETEQLLPGSTHSHKSYINGPKSLAYSCYQ